MAKILLLDNNDQNNQFLSKSFDKTIISPNGNSLFWTWIRGATTTLRLSSQGDTIVCWYDFQAILLYFLCKTTFKKRTIICLNILLKQKKTFINKIITFLYKIALSDKNFKATVTSVEYGKLLNKHFGKSFKYTILHDVFHNHYKINNDTIMIKPNTVFCGGRNGRDWDFMFDVAKSLPDITFNIIVPKSVCDDYINRIGINVNLKTNVSYNEFINEMLSSEIVCLPLDTEAPAGLIVLFQAAANDKLVITTDTATTREYITEDSGVLLPNIIEEWQDAIKKHLSNKILMINKAKNLHSFLEKKCSENAFINIINSMITK